MENKTQTALAALIIAIGMVLAAALLSQFLVRIERENMVVVKGFAAQNVTSDIGELNCQVRVSQIRFQDAYELLKKQVAQVTEVISKDSPADISIKAVQPFLSHVFKKNEKGLNTNQIEYYTASQSLTVSSNNVSWVKSKNVSLNDLLSSGIMVSCSEPKFLVSNLNAVKFSLIKEATANGKKRAALIAEGSGGTVGKLSSAKQGVFQITEPNSTETSSYGYYDTSTIEKEVKAVVTLSFVVE